MSRPPSSLRLAYYADDFTGATDALERLELAGTPTTLWLAPPPAGTPVAEPGVEAIGVAGCVRSLPTDKIADAVEPVLRTLRSSGAAHVHYKVCSTFDSSPDVGSIGRVIDVADRVFDVPFIPVVVGSPELGRWCVFGNLFAGMGIGAGGPVYRLDRHPSMSQHPTTPALESDLRRCLAEQTDKPIGLVDVRALSAGAEQTSRALERVLAEEQPRIVLFDAAAPEHLDAIGQTLDAYGTPDKPLFWVGSSAVESALTSAWRAGAPRTVDGAGADGAFGPVLVLSGSCSPVTAAQIAAAEQLGCRVAVLDVSAAGAPTLWQEAIDRAAAEALSCLRRRESVVLAARGDNQAGRLCPRQLGQAFASIADSCLADARPGLLVIAGGDTSSHTATALGVDQLEFCAPLTAGAPVCRARSSNPTLNGQLVVFKGGQVGREDLLANLIHPPKQEA